MKKHELETVPADDSSGLGQIIGQTSFAGVQTAWTYNNLSEILTETVGSGGLAQTTTNTWDALGDKLSTQDANGTTTMAYNLLGAMTSLTDPDKNQTAWTRDNLGRVIAEQNPSGTETFGYDANSNLVKQVDFDGHERDFVFDDLNRETAEKWMNGATVLNTISTAYNAAGQVTSTGDNYSDYGFAYNGQGDQTSVDNAGTPGAPHVVLTNQFDALGNRTSLAATLNGTADFINNYSYDTLSRLRDITQQSQTGGNAVAPKSIYIGLNGVGDITALNDANTVSAGPQQTSPGYVTLTYSPTTGLLTNINDTANGTSIDNLAYTYDALARANTFTSIDGTATYGYDHTSQLVSSTYTTATGGHQPANVNFTWDANGNNAAPGNVVSPNNEVTNDGTFTYTFDADGNRTSRTNIYSAYSTDYKTTYTWDYRNRLTDVEFFDNNNVVTKHVHYVYDVYDNLIEEDIDPNGGGTYTTKEQFVLDVNAKVPTAGNAPLEHFDGSGNLVPLLPDDVLMELVNNQLTERFLNGPSPSGAADIIYAAGAVESLTQPDTVDWIFVNNQGSPTDVVNSSGTLLDHQVYSAFGQVAYASNSAVFLLQGFSGGYADQSTGFIKDGERWYDPTAMVWLSVDPAGFRAGDANVSRYVDNNPMDFTDAVGLFPDAGGEEKYSDPVIHAPLGAPADIREAIGNRYNNPEILKAMMEIAKQQAEDVEKGGYVCWNKQQQKLFLYVIEDTSKNTVGNTHRTWFPVNPKENARNANPPQADNPDAPDENLTIFHGFHTHPTDRDAWPSRTDRSNAKAVNNYLTEIVIYYYEPCGAPTWKFHFVSVGGGRYFEWTPPPEVLK